MVGQDVTRIAVVDDEVQDITFGKLDEETQKALFDENSDEHNELITYLKSHNGLLPEEFDSENLDDIEEYFRGELFKDVLRTHEFNTADVAFLKEAIDQAKEETNYLIYLNIEKAFPAPEFKISYFAKRPRQPGELKDFDLIFMDMFMDDDYSTPTTVSNYLKSVKETCTQDSHPSVIVMSIESSLILQRESLRMITKMSALSFHAEAKQNLDEKNSPEYLKLLWLGMNEYKETSLKVTTLYAALSDLFKEKWEMTEKLLWNMDAAQLLTMYDAIHDEGIPYEEGMLEMIVKNYLRHVEQGISEQPIFESLKDDLKQIQPKGIPAFAYESTTAGHNIQASLYVSGTADSNRPQIKKFEEGMLAPELLRMVPFGGFFSPDQCLQYGTKGAINITQLCDLSKHIHKNDVYFLLLEAEVVKAEEVKNTERLNFVPIELVSSDEELYYLKIGRRINSYTVTELLDIFVEEECREHIRLRTEFVRQFREHLFQNLSRYEAAPRFHRPVALGKPYLVFKGKEGKNSKRRGVFEAVEVNGQHHIYKAIFEEKGKSYRFCEANIARLSVEVSLRMKSMFDGPNIEPAEIQEMLRSGITHTPSDNGDVWRCCVVKNVNAINVQGGYPTLYMDMEPERTTSLWPDSVGQVKLATAEDKT